jgi:hypothetical protein
VPQALPQGLALARLAQAPARLPPVLLLALALPARRPALPLLLPRSLRVSEVPDLLLFR